MCDRPAPPGKQTCSGHCTELMMSEPPIRNRAQKTAHELGWKFRGMHEQNARLYRKKSPWGTLHLKIPPFNRMITMSHLWNGSLGIIMRISRSRWLRDAQDLEDQIVSMMRKDRNPQNARSS